MLKPFFTEPSNLNVFSSVSSLHEKEGHVCRSLEESLVLLSESQSRLKHKSFHSDFSTDIDTPFINDLHRSSRIK